jgi:hypothetical protein
MAATRTNAKYKAGEWVLRTYWPNPQKVQILEDMGCLGVDGEHVYFVFVPGEEGFEGHTQTLTESRVIGPA